mgnify:CR=1 FL=1
MDEFDKKNLDRELREVEAKIDELHRQSSSVLRDTEDKYHEQVDRLKERTIFLQGKIEDASDGGEEVWDNMRHGFYGVIEEVKGAYDEIKKRI